MRFKKIREVIRRHKTFLITTHENPDWDALCSELGMAIYLRALGKKVYIINDEKLPARYAFLPGAKAIGHYAVKKDILCEAAIVLDCGELRRTGKVVNLIRGGVIVVNMDHHVTNDFFGDFNVVDPQASSTAEMLYTFLRRVRHPLTKELALNLYAGIMTDTGSFRFENTSAYTHRVISELMKFGFSVTDVYQKTYESIPLSDLKGFAGLVSRFRVLFRGRVVYLDLPQRIVSKFSEDFDLRDAIFKFLRLMKGAEVFIIFTEIDRHTTRVNLRSSSTVDVARLAQYFNGGGHTRASGCTVEGSIPHAREKMIKQIRRILQAGRER